MSTGPRGDIHYVVTEYGIADLYGRTARQRALALIDIAHPDHRGELLDFAKGAALRLPRPADPAARRGRTRKDLETTCTLTTHETVLVRPIKPADDDLMLELFYAFSEEVLRARSSYEPRRGRPRGPRRMARSRPGYLMLGHVTRIARTNGVEGFTALVLADNRRLLRLFYKSGYLVRSQFDGEIYNITIRFYEKAKAA